MSTQTDEVVKLAAGSIAEMTALKVALAEAGIEGKMVGDDLSAGIGSTLVDSVEVWVHANDAERAAIIVEEHEAGRIDL